MKKFEIIHYHIDLGGKIRLLGVTPLWNHSTLDHYRFLFQTGVNFSITFDPIEHELIHGNYFFEQRFDAFDLSFFEEGQINCLVQKPEKIEYFTRKDWWNREKVQSFLNAIPQSTKERWQELINNKPNS
ncbi:MAG: hypothetical protein H6581_17040 [Bacteroidia bacterium]|nr:hypothetical protein [Bacteroidia bacterium]